MSVPAPTATRPPESKCRQQLRTNLRAWLFKAPQPVARSQKNDPVPLTESTDNRPINAVNRPILSQHTEMDDEHVTNVGPERTLMWRGSFPSILEEVRTPIKLMLFQHLAPGDAIMLSAAVRDLKAAWGDKFLIDVRTPYPELFANNPWLTKLDMRDPEVNKVQTHYTWWVNRFNDTPCHFINGIRMDLEQRLGLTINQGAFHGDLHFTDDELQKPNLAQEKLGDCRYWVIDAGGKFDFTCKWWEFERYQALVEGMRDMTFVQVGRNDDVHPRLAGPNVVNLIGQTHLRELLRVIYTADGVITPVSLPMHAAAAVPPHPRNGHRPHCVVIAGAREPPQWEQYPHHAFLSTCGTLPCCREGGCNKTRVKAIQDGKKYDSPTKLCLRPVDTDSGQTIPLCMERISVDAVESAIRSFLP